MTMTKREKITVVLLGSGNFGVHYARILSRLNGKRIPHLPHIGTLVLTKTLRKSAIALAEEIRMDADCAVDRVIGEEVSNAEDAARLLDHYAPGFTAIAARDKKTGNAVHAEYSRHALRHGAVLCEKPFMDAFGDGASLESCRRFFSHENIGLFGLELPMAAVSRHMQASGLSKALFANVSRIHLHWETLRSRDILNDLAIHPWSLIADEFEIEPVRVDRDRDTMSVHLHLIGVGSKPASCDIVLREGGGNRSIRIDERLIRIETHGANMRFVENGNVLIETENPLEQNIVSVLKGKPLVGLKRTYESQLFLEKLHGYDPSHGARSQGFDSQEQSRNS